MEQVQAETAYDGEFVSVARGRFRRAGGEEVEREVVVHPGSVGILAHDEEFVHLVRQPREAVGLRAERWSELQAVFPSPGYLSEKHTIFEATGLSPAPGESDETEQIEIVHLPLAEIGSTLARIEDAKTLVGLLLLKDRLRG